MSKITVLFGSPRKNSNTQLLVNEALRAVSDHEIETIYLNDLNIRGCQACYFCKRNDTTKCAVTDDMQQVYQSLESTDALIVATPIYFCDVSAQMKLIVDRLFPYYDMHLRSGFPKGKKVSFIISQNQPNRQAFRRHIDDFEAMFRMLGFRQVEELLVENIDKGYKPMVTENQEIMKKAYNLGLNLV